jgi:hypothetical protein
VPVESGAAFQTLKQGNKNMISVQNVRQASIAASYTAGATASLTADCLACDYLTVYASLGVQTNATAVPTAFALQFSDVTNSTTFVTYTNFATSLPYTNQVASFTNNYLTANTSSNDTLAFMFSLSNSPGRYAKLIISPGYTQVIAATMILSRLEQVPYVSTALTASSSWGLAIQPMIG